MRVYHDLFFATRIQINVSWSGSGSGQMILIQSPVVGIKSLLRWGGARDTGTIDMDKFRSDVIKEDKENQKKKVLEDGYNAAHG